MSFLRLVSSGLKLIPCERPPGDRAKMCQVVFGIGDGGQGACHNCSSFLAAITNCYKLYGLNNRKVLLWPGGQKSDVRFAQLVPPGGDQGESVPT